MSKEKIIYPDGRGDVPSKGGLVALAETQKLRTKALAAALVANARATGVNPAKALLQHGSVEVYKATTE